MKKLIKGKKGFTLIELVIVIAILGILAGIAIPRFLDATATARGAKIVADLRTIDSAIVIYNAKTGAYPADTDALTTAADATGTVAAKYQLLAAWPEPSTGSVIFPAKPSKTETVATGAKYDLGTGTTLGRGVLGTKTATDLAAGGGGYTATATTNP